MACDQDLERTPLLQHRDDQTQSPEPECRRRRRDESAPVPWAALWALWLMNVVPGLAFEIILPFVNSMLMENGVARNPEEVGFYSGITESLFAVVQVLTVVPFSYLSDSVGRKPIVILGNFGVAVSTACFGLSKTFQGMLVSRALGGALGGSWAAMRVMLAEMVPKHFHATAFGGIGMCYRLGQILGLPLGGFLSHPERHFPQFAGEFWLRYPFALPCFVGAAFAILTGVYGLIALRETLKNPWRPSLPQRKECSSGYSTPSDQSDYGQAKSIVSLSSVLTHKTIHILVSNFLTAFFAEVLFALYPLFSFTPRRSGGLGLNEAQIGTHMSIRAVIAVVAMMLFPTLERRLGTAKLYKLVTSLWSLNVCLFPIAGYFAYKYDDPNHPVVWATILLLFVVWSITGLSWSCASILVNDATPSPEALSRLNAISQLSIVIPQALAPATGTSLFAISVRSNILGGNLIWGLLFLGACAFAAHAWIYIDNDVPEDFDDDRTL